MNLVVLPLEGVSQTMFWQYREAMPALWAFSERSMQFRNFHSSSTSAVQSFCDFMYGDAGELDHYAAFPAETVDMAGRASNIFTVLHDRGYSILALAHDNCSLDHPKNNLALAWPKELGAFHRCGEYREFFNAADDFLRRARTEGKPFAVYYADRVACPNDVSREKDDAPLYHERIEKGFSLLDGSIGRFLRQLDESGLRNDTLIVAYGPIGMDLWRHGIRRGQVMNIAPYADISWTPLLLMAPNGDFGITDCLTSLIDLKPTLLHMLFPDDARAELKSAAGSLSGINIVNYGRRMALVQNMCALEREGEGSLRGMAKSYAVTNGEFRVIATSNRGIPGDEGVEFFFDARDPGNTRNLLDFFTLDDEGTLTSFGRQDVFHVHFTQSFHPRFIQGIAKNYHGLRSYLHSAIRAKERLAGEVASPSTSGNIFPDAAFMKKKQWE